MEKTKVSEITPLTVIENISSYLEYPEHAFPILDPCCADGSAVLSLAGENGVAYGVETVYELAKTAKEKLKKALNSPLGSCRISHDAFSVVFVNPPSKEVFEGFEKVRTEFVFLRDTEKYLTVSGVLVYIVERQWLAEHRIARFLNSRFTNLQVFSVPSEGGSTKAIVLASKRSKPHAPEETVLNDFVEQVSSDLPELCSTDSPAYTIPSRPVNIPIFRSLIIDRDDLVADLRKSSLWGRMQSLSTPRDMTLAGTPAMPFHQGHIALLLASGALNGAIGKKDSPRFNRNTKGYYVCPDCENEIGWLDGYKVHHMTDDEAKTRTKLNEECPNCHAPLWHDTRHLIKGLVSKRQRDVDSAVDVEESPDGTSTEPEFGSAIDYYQITVKVTLPDGNHISLT